MEKKNAKWFFVLTGILFLMVPVLAINLYEGQIISRETFKSIDLNMTMHEMVQIYEPVHEDTNVSFENDFIKWGVSFFNIVELDSGDFQVTTSDLHYYATPIVEDRFGMDSWMTCTEGNPLNIPSCWTNYFLPKLKALFKVDIRNYHEGMIELQKKIIAEDFFDEFDPEDFPINDFQ